MNARPIIFTGPMVRAIITGKKTMTRRVVHSRDAAKLGLSLVSIASRLAPDVPSAPIVIPIGIRSYQVGHLWVKETAYISSPDWGDARDATHTDAEGRPRIVSYVADHGRSDGAEDYGVRKSPSIYMPRWASRLTLQVTAVRVERLWAITEADAMAEGMSDDRCMEDRRTQFAHVWDTIGKRAPWASNPWVWVVSFAPVNQ